MKEKVLFLCTGNSARSQMAEAVTNTLMGAWWEAHSAGTNPAGYVHPMAVRALHELNIEHEGRSKSTEEFRGEQFDLVVTVCDDAAENCPVWLGKGKKVHLGFPDPAKATGTEEDVLEAFRTVRDAIVEQIPKLLMKHTNNVLRLGRNDTRSCNCGNPDRGRTGSA